MQKKSCKLIYLFNQTAWLKVHYRKDLKKGFSRAKTVQLMPLESEAPSQTLPNGFNAGMQVRGNLQTLLGAMTPDGLVTNEPARIQCGAPDFIVTRKDVPICAGLKS